MNKINEQTFDELLDRYIDNDVTGDEEERLMQMLDDVADEHMPAGMEQRLESFIEDLADEVAPVVALEPKATKGYTLTSYFRKYRIAACAVLAIAASVAFGTLVRNNGTGFTDTCSTPAEAEAQMLKALTMLSSPSQPDVNELLQHMAIPAQPDYSKFISFD